jgi:two-component system chemotaxis response regulator CheY
MKALIADDSLVSRRVLFGILQHDCEFDEIATAEDGAQAEKMALEESFDLILLDWHMPEKLGVEVLESIRAANIETPVIIVTGESDRDSVVYAYDRGADNFIVKPYAPKTIVTKIQQTMNGIQHHAEQTMEKRVLIADDSPVMLRLLSGVLEGMGMFKEVVQVGDGLEALNRVKNESFDLVTLDWNMPEMSGIDALRNIRKFDTHIPVIMVTSEKEGPRVVEAFEAGANNYVIKPFDTASVETKIRQSIRFMNHEHTE